MTINLIQKLKEMITLHLYKVILVLQKLIMIQFLVILILIKNLFKSNVEIILNHSLYGSKLILILKVKEVLMTHIILIVTQRN